MLERLRTFVVERFWSRTVRRGGIRTWMHEPRARAYVNERITGSPHRWPLEWLAAEVVRAPFPRALSIGCGDGALERDLVRKGICETAVGVDISATALARARELARCENLTAIRYERADFNALELPAAAFEAVFFHQALHHVRNLESCLAAVARTLTAGGLLYLDEYVGPSRHQWTRSHLAPADAVYAQLPGAIRRRRRLQLPVDWRDPSEAIRSSEILAQVRERFTIRHQRDYGGNLLSVIYPHLVLDGLAADQRSAVIDRLIAAERAHLAAGAGSYYAVIVATKNGASPTRAEGEGA